MTNAIDILRENHCAGDVQPDCPSCQALAKMETLLQAADHCIDIVEGRVARSNESVTNAWHALAAAVRDVKGEND